MSKISVAGALRILVGASILLGGALLTYFTTHELYRNKLQDTWVIMYLDLEQEGNYLIETLRSPDQEDIWRARPEVTQIFKEDSRGNLTSVQGSITEQVTGRSFGFDSNEIPKNLSDVTLVEYAGVIYRLTRSSEQIKLEKIRPQLLADGLKKSGKDSSALVYVLTREGKLIYANDSKLSALNFVKRPLVQKFIMAPLTLGQIEFRDPDGFQSYGFFRAVTNSNFVMFSEIPRAKAMAAVFSLMWKFVWIVFGIIFAVFCVMHIPLSKLMLPLRDLSYAAQRIGDGEFGTRIKTTGFGEIGVLTAAFNSMIERLGDRDNAILKLNQEQLELARLESELKVAQGIQSNLLPNEPLPDDSHLDVAAAYIPSAECAGDWYNYHYNATAHETIILVIDVSGHGAGASIFTAILAGVFDRFVASESGPWDLDALIQQCSGVMYRMGRGAWHATILAGRFDATKKEMDFYCAGHHGPLICTPGSNGKFKIQRLNLPSDVVGLSPLCQVAHKTVSLSPGMHAVMYTDYLVEARTPMDGMIGSRSIHKLFERIAADKSESILVKAISGWRALKAPTQSADDLCVVVVRAV